ncbi:hypothetical protein MFFC18_03950 [Mariniblastus fucicola]|uniref:Uncharacterized protein n=2 Tax=Mariniblastus fucicola TaxID=980251 RepID=A0A5B9P7G7_9BACT|nr:hypothetical protein MFFC18_03950 [Mariniblastus fucicola]
MIFGVRLAVETLSLKPTSKSMSQYPEAEYATQQKGYHQGPKSTSGLAIGSLVLGVSSFICTIFTGAIAIILGIIALSKISSSNGRLAGNGLAIAGIVTGALGCVWTLIMIGMLLPAVQQVRSAARRTMTMNNMRQMSLANLNHESTYMRFASNISEEDPESGENLSWRVHLLPYLGYQELYNQFKLNEPWDSAHNKSLIGQIPEVFQHPQIQAELPEGYTVFQFAVSPPGTENPALYVQGERGATFGEITDGSSNTIMILETSAAAAVPWTQPKDWQFDPDDPTRGVGDSFPGGFVVTFCDGATSFIDDGIGAQNMKSLVTRSEGDTPNHMAY